MLAIEIASRPFRMQKGGFIAIQNPFRPLHKTFECPMSAKGACIHNVHCLNLRTDSGVRTHKGRNKLPR